MNVDQLRRSLKQKWLSYYQDNRSWLIRLAVWVNCDGARRPSSSFILATLAALEPKLTDLLPLVVDLTQHPDRIVMALGLNFNPEEELQAISPIEEETRLLPEGKRPDFQPRRQKSPAQEDETCKGR
jgi:hypothetical protein